MQRTRRERSKRPPIATASFFGNAFYRLLLGNCSRCASVRVAFGSPRSRESFVEYLFHSRRKVLRQPSHGTLALRSTPDRLRKVGIVSVARNDVPVEMRHGGPEARQIDLVWL